MTAEVLKAVSDGMTALGLNYAFMRWEGDTKDTHFKGEYLESEPTTEDGLIGCEIIITGCTRASWEELESAKEKIRRYFHPIYGKRVIAEDGSAVTIFYAGGFPVPTGEAELKKIEIHLTVKEWKVI